MAEADKKREKEYDAEDRFKYIGFEVFPGKAGSIFKSDDERQSIVERVRQRFQSSNADVRDRCTLMEERVSAKEKYLLGFMALLMVFSLFIPWFSGYIPVTFDELTLSDGLVINFTGQSDEESVQILAGYYRDRLLHPPIVIQVIDKKSSQSGGAQAATGEAEPERNTKEGSSRSEILFFDASPEDLSEWNVPLGEDKKSLLVGYFHYDRDAGIDNLVYGNSSALIAADAYFVQPVPESDSLVSEEVANVVADTEQSAVVTRVAQKTKMMTVSGTVNSQYSISGVGALISLGQFSSIVFGDWEIPYYEMNRVKNGTAIFTYAPENDYPTLKMLAETYKEGFQKAFPIDHSSIIPKDSSLMVYVLFFNEMPGGVSWQTPLAKDVSDYLVATYRFDILQGPDTLIFGHAPAMAYARDFIVPPSSMVFSLDDGTDEATEEEAESDSLAVAVASSFSDTNVPAKSLRKTGGIVLIVSFLTFLILMISCLAMAGINLFVIFGAGKRNADNHALYLKKMLKFNWIPVYLWLGLMGLSFFGSSYGFKFDPTGVLHQVGESYSISTFIGLSSFGIYLALAAFLVSALKGKEI